MSMVSVDAAEAGTCRLSRVPMSYKILLLIALFAPIILVAAGRWTHFAGRNRLQTAAQALSPSSDTRSN